MREELKNMIRTSLEDVMHESFMPYAEYVILERAIPRVEDGLKPVQRHILYAMHEMQLLPTNKHKKCARIVGDTMGKYHPHGDSSIYEALARMAQDFSMEMPLIDGQGNFGSIDGDGPAAMRYTEARMAPLALEMLRDIEKETVPFHLNFDDSLKEPTILPSRYPNLLVNGCSGIAVGLATNIPPHNLAQAIDGVVLRMNQPDCTLDEMMHCIPAPDFPTGGILLCNEGIRQAYETGKGKITLRAKVSMEKGKNGKTNLVISELPYEVRESAMLKKIHQLRSTKKELFAGISDVRSETDRSGIRAVIELKNGVDPKKVLDCLYKYSDLQISYGVNMVVIADGQPKQLGLLSLLDYYIAFQRKVVTNRVQYDLEQAQEKEHKLKGLIIAVDHLDEVIQIIRSSANTKEAKQRLMKALALTGVQAQCILDLRLARLTQLEIADLREEYAKVVALIAYLESILHSKKKLDAVIQGELLEIKKKYGIKRRTALSKESAEIIIDMDHFKVKEDCAVVFTKGGKLKRLTPKALTAGMEAGNAEESNQPLFLLETNTDARIQLFSNKGNLYTLDAKAIKEAKFKDAGSPLSALLPGLEKEEHILSMLPPGKGKFLTVSCQGFVKITDRSEFETKKTKILACGLKEKDTLLFAAPLFPEKETLLLVTSAGMSIRFSLSEISEQGRIAKGIGGIKLGQGESVIFAAQIGKEGYVSVFSDLGYAKQTALSEYEIQGRNGKGLKTFFFSKDHSFGNRLVAAFYSMQPHAYQIATKAGQVLSVSSAQLPLEARYAKGVQIIPVAFGDTIVQVTMQQN